MEIRFVMRIDEWLKIKAYMRVYMYHTNQILVMGFIVAMPKIQT
jgi:hypothetical protein